MTISERIEAARRERRVLTRVSRAAWRLDQAQRSTRGPDDRSLTSTPAARRARRGHPAGSRPPGQIRAKLTGALSRFIERPGDDEHRAPDSALPVLEWLASDLTGRRP